MIEIVTRRDSDWKNYPPIRAHAIATVIYYGEMILFIRAPDSQDWQLPLVIKLKDKTCGEMAVATIRDLGVRGRCKLHLVGALTFDRSTEAYVYIYYTDIKDFKWDSYPQGFEEMGFYVYLPRTLSDQTKLILDTVNEARKSGFYDK